MAKGKKLTKKQKEFADEYLDTGNGTQSALKTYDTVDYDTANQIAVENLQKPTVIEYLQQHASAISANMVRLALGAESERDQITAGKDVLDRSGYKPVDKTDITSKGEQIMDRPDLDELVKSVEEELKRRKTI